MAGLPAPSAAALYPGTERPSAALPVLLPPTSPYLPQHPALPCSLAGLTQEGTQWSPHGTAAFPPPFQAAVRLLDTARRRYQGGNKASLLGLPEELYHKILRLAARPFSEWVQIPTVWLPHGPKTRASEEPELEMLQFIQQDEQEAPGMGPTLFDIMSGCVCEISCCKPLSLS